MTSPTIYDLDHPMISVASHDEARARHEALGFRVREVRGNGPMGGAERGGDGGSAIILFPSANAKTANYLELSHTDPETALPFMKALLGDQEGMVMAVHCTPDAQGVHDAWSKAGCTLLPLWSVDFPATAQSQAQTMKLFIPQPGSNVMQCNAVQYGSLDEYRNESLMDHPNTACGWDQVTVVAADDGVEAVSDFYETLYGNVPTPASSGILEFRHETTSLRIVPKSGALEALGNQPLPSGRPLPAFASLRVKVRNMDVLKTQLSSNNIGYSDTPRSVFTPAENGCGMIYEFTAI